MKSHNEFIEEVVEASSLPAQTRQALGPESDEDRKMHDYDLGYSTKDLNDAVHKQSRECKING